MSTIAGTEISHRLDAPTGELPDLAEWDLRPKTQMITEKAAAACPYLGGSEQKPRDVRTLKRWRDSRRGPSFLKIGGRYYYTIGALREFYQRSVRGGAS